MAIALVSVVVKHERRVQLVFSNALGAGAFGLSPTLYVIVNQDGLGPSPSVSAALIVPNSANVVELALVEPLVGGALYVIEAEGVPAVDLSVTPPGTQEQVRVGDNQERPNQETIVKYSDVLLYGEDLVWTGEDFQETPTGDLELVSGVPNVTKALHRRLKASGRPWDKNYGTYVENFVDSPIGLAGNVRGAMMSQTLSDPRVKAVSVAMEVGESESTFMIAPTLVTGATLEPVAITVPNDT